MTALTPETFAAVIMFHYALPHIHKEKSDNLWAHTMTPLLDRDNEARAYYRATAKAARALVPERNQE